MLSFCCIVNSHKMPAGKLLQALEKFYKSFATAIISNLITVLFIKFTRFIKSLSAH